MGDGIQNIDAVLKKRADSRPRRCKFYNSFREGEKQPPQVRVRSATNLLEVLSDNRDSQLGLCYTALVLFRGKCRDIMNSTFQAVEWVHDPEA